MSWATSFSRGNFTFRHNATAQVSSPGSRGEGNGLRLCLTFCLASIYTSTYAVQIAKANYVRGVYGAFVDDNYKITPKITISGRPAL